MIRKKFVMAAICMLLLCVACQQCSTVQTTKPYEIGKVTAETILYEARVLQNRGQLSAADFESIKGIYDKLRDAQDVAIDARIALIKYHSADNDKKVEAAMLEVVRLSTELLTLASKYNIGGGQ